MPLPGNGLRPHLDSGGAEPGDPKEGMKLWRTRTEKEVCDASERVGLKLTQSICTASIWAKIPVSNFLNIDINRYV